MTRIGVKHLDMRLLTLMLAVLAMVTFLWIGSAQPGPLCSGVDTPTKNINNTDSVTVSTTAVPLPSSTGPSIRGAKFAIVQIEGGDIRYLDDGTIPTGSFGTRINASTAPATFVVCGASMGKIRLIRETGSGDVELIVQYYG